MAKLNQIIAVAQGKKALAEKALTAAHHLLAKGALLEGIARTYKPVDEAGESLPPESKNVQLTVGKVISDLTPTLSDWFDVVATQESSNTVAVADVEVNGKLIAAGVPVTVLLFLERRLVDLNTFISKLPVLDPAEDWAYDSTSDAYVTPEHQTTKTKKVPKVLVKYEATKEHPAQTDVYSEDTVVGRWTTKKFSGAIPLQKKKTLLERLHGLQEAVKFAREQANSIDIIERTIGEEVLGFLFGS